MSDVVVVGAGPAGCIASIVLARAGARVLLLDRARFPRRKLCGDTLNPGARALLDRLGLAAAAERGGRRVDGMIVSGAGVSVVGRYPGGAAGLALTREVFDMRLLEAAGRAGVDVAEGTAARGAVVDYVRGRPTVAGIRLASHGAGAARVVRSPICVAADGRHSTLAFSLGLARHPASPRRWAVGAYYTGADGVGSFGEMHVRAGHYVGVAAVPDGLVNVCLVTSDRSRLRDPDDALAGIVASDPALRARFSRARRATPVATIGPLAVEASAAGMPGLLLAGDAAGFIDPMTGDGLRFALRGGELAARAALDALATGNPAAHERLAAWRREFRRKRAFDRALRALVASPRAIRAAAAAARIAPLLIRHAVRVAGDLPRPAPGARSAA